MTSASGTARRAGELHQAVADEIRILLLRRRMKGANELAEKIGMSQSAMSRRMVGEQPFDLDDLVRIADALDVKVVDLVGRAEKGQDGTYVSVGFPPLDVTTPSVVRPPRPRTPVFAGPTRGGPPGRRDLRGPSVKTHPTSR